MSKEQILEILNRATIIKEFSINLVKFSGVNEAMKATKRNSLHARICRECGTKYMVYKISGSRCPECKSHMSIEYEGGDINNLDIDPFTNALIENKK